MDGDAAPDVLPSAELKGFYAAFEASPGDFTGYGACADLLDELGYPPLAHAYRWMMRREKFPHRRSRYAGYQYQPGRAVSKAHRWAWYEERRLQDPDAPVYGVLPQSPKKFHTLHPLLIPGRQSVFPSHQAAVMALAGWLGTLRGVAELEPPRRGLS